MHVRIEGEHAIKSPKDYPFTPSYPTLVYPTLCCESPLFFSYIQSNLSYPTPVLSGTSYEDQMCLGKQGPTKPVFGIPCLCSMHCCSKLKSVVVVHFLLFIVLGGQRMITISCCPRETLYLFNPGEE